MSPYRENEKPSEREEWERAVRRLSRAFERFGMRCAEIAERHREMLIRSGFVPPSNLSDSETKKA